MPRISLHSVKSKLSLTRFTVSLLLTGALVIALAGAFASYVVKDKQVDRANELRQAAFLLADELRQSSDDLTRMARSYAVTGNPLFKKYYRDILDIRDGKKPRPVSVGRVYWDFVLAGDRTPRADSLQHVALLEMIRQLELNDAESAKLRLAKFNSDVLAATEEEAMRLAESTGPGAAEDRALANSMLHDDTYHRAKGAIMGPIDDFLVLTERRTLDAVLATERAAMIMRYAFIAIGAALVLMLWRTYSLLRRTMGGPLDEVHAEIAALGHGDLSRSILVKKGLRDSVMGWLAETQVKLAGISRERERAMQQLRESELQFRQLAENINEVFFLIDTAGTKMLYVSPAYEALWGRSCESLYADVTSWREAIHPQDRAKVFEAMPPGAQRGQFEVEFRFLRADESLRSIRLRGFPIRDDAGEIQRVAGIAEDTTHRMELEAITREIDRRFSHHADSGDARIVDSESVWETSAAYRRSRRARESASLRPGPAPAREVERS
jgi:PAS domain S-box-containing protein